ncbi:unnamed protein product [Rotaria magnacalcarata]|uniref:UBX domain-containing protein 4 n=4 Tax=Rotaria magnacalcarata TaxID=392030 RepID=A0A819QLW3_9BILA|nr:unnamed protein product [Rotaria magnacalcarata]CAF4031016.1 unnamed protein product [Rotaria magnacalcarata]
MEPWYSGAIVDAVCEAKSRRALFIVYIHDNSEQSQFVDNLWIEVWTKLTNLSQVVALRLAKDTEASKQFQAIYKIQTYPTIYLINGQNGQVLKMIDQPLENSSRLEEILQQSMNIIEPKQQDIAATTATIATNESNRTVEEKVAEARARLKAIQDKRDEEAKEKEKQEEMERRRLGQQMLLDKQKKDEELLRKQAEEIRRDKIEQQKLQEKLKAQIQQDREDKRRKYEEEQSATAQQTKPKVTTTQVQAPKINYDRSRLQFRLTDGSFFTEDFSPDARMNQVYAYLQETLPTDQYRNGSYVLRTTHTRTTLARDNPSSLKDLELVPSAVLLVINRGNGNTSSSSTSVSTNNIFQSFQLMFAWFIMQFNFIYQLISSKLFGHRTPTAATSPREQIRPSTRKNNANEQRAATPKTTKENFKVDSTEKTTIRRFHNTQDDSDDEEKRTWNGNSTQQM